MDLIQTDLRIYHNSYDEKVKLGKRRAGSMNRKSVVGMMRAEA